MCVYKNIDIKIIMYIQAKNIHDNDYVYKQIFTLIVVNVKSEFCENLKKWINMIKLVISNYYLLLHFRNDHLQWGNLSKCI